MAGAILLTLLTAGPAFAQTTKDALEIFRQGQSQLAEGHYKEAEATYRKALTAFQKAQGPDSLDAGTTLGDIALTLKAQGRYKEAEATYRQALAIQRKAGGPKHPGVATTLQNLANLYLDMGRFREAEPLFQEALQLLAERPGPELVGALINAARLTSLRGRYAESEAMMIQSIGLAERLYGAQHPFIGQLLINLISLYNEQGRSKEAEQLTQRVTALFKPHMDEQTPEAISMLTILAAQEAWQGRADRGVVLMQRALDLSTRLKGAEHADTAQLMTNVATFQLLDGKPAEAEVLLRRALAIQEKALGADHLDLADTLASLGGALILQDHYADCEAVALRQIAILDKRLGKKHPRVAEALLNLAALYQLQGKHKQARGLLDRALKIVRTTFGDAHPLVAEALHKLGEVARAQGRLSEALKLHQQASDLDETLLALRLSVASEPQKRVLIDQLNDTTRQLLALHWSAAPTSEPAARLALTTVLRRKGRALDALADDVAVLRSHLGMQEATLLDQLQESRSQLASMSLAATGATDPALRKQLDALSDSVHRQEQALLASSDAFRGQEQPATIDAVQRALPSDGALVEFVTWEPFDPTPRTGPDDGVQTWGPPRMAAYVLHPDGALQWVDLGPTAELDAQLQRFRKALLRCPTEGEPRSGACLAPGWNLEEVKAEGAATAKLVWAPLEPSLKGVEHVILAPDGELNLLPFGALVDASGRFLVESRRLSLVTTGRDLLRFGTVRASTAAPVVVSDPNYDVVDKVAPTPVMARRASALSSVHWDRLKGTAAEGASVGARLTGVRTYSGERADERTLKGVHAPSILHIATHGFFLKDAPDGRAASTRGFIRPAGAEAAKVPEHPLIRSGLVFAGANAGGRQGEDGFLTALEVSSVDLWGTQLVVLSACETGLGDVQNGQGVYGLRRALVLAGAASQITSLWQVDDAGTLDLMDRTYSHLSRGVGPAEALRLAQRELLADKAHVHPWFWASFTAAGQWTPLEGVTFAPVSDKKVVK